MPKIEDIYKKAVESDETSGRIQEYASLVETRLLLRKLGETVNRLH